MKTIQVPQRAPEPDLGHPFCTVQPLMMLYGVWTVLCAGAHVVVGRLVLHGHLDAVGQETQDGADPEQDGETAKQLTAELDPLWSGGWRCQGVGSIPGQDLGSSGVSQALRGKSRSFTGCVWKSYYVRHNVPFFHRDWSSDFTAAAEHQPFLSVWSTCNISSDFLLLTFSGVRLLD